MIPEKDMNALIQYYKGELTKNAQLTKAAKLAARKHVLMKSGLPPPVVNAQTKPLSQELMKLTKRIRQFPGGVGPGGGGGGAGGLPGEDDEEEGDLVTGPVEQWLKHMIKGSPSTPKPSIASRSQKDTPAAPTSALASTSKRSLPATPTSFKKGKPSPSRIPVRPRDPGQGRGRGKRPSREVERLKDWAKGWKDWEDWD